MSLVESVVLGARHDDEIVWSVVRPILIDVVHDLSRLQAKSSGLFPDETMFRDVAVAIREMVAGHVEQDVAVVIDLPTTVPQTAGLTTKWLSMIPQVPERRARDLSGRGASTSSEQCALSASALTDSVGQQFRRQGKGRPTTFQHVRDSITRKG